MYHTIGVVFCPNHGEKIVCVGVLLDGVAHTQVDQDIWKTLMQSANMTTHFQLCYECKQKSKL